jgi:origin recognition complex subunit 2
VSDNYPGISFMELYSLCRAEFLVASDLGLRAQLKEFLDHKLMKMKKGRDGGEYLTIPIQMEELADFLSIGKNIGWKKLSVSESVSAGPILVQP